MKSSFIFIAKIVKQMFRFIIRLQAAVIFSSCLGWDRLVPEPDFNLIYTDKTANAPTNTDNKLELAENFTQFLQKKNKKTDEIKLGKKDSYSDNLWVAVEDNFNNMRQETPNIDKPQITKEDKVEYELDTFKFWTKKSHVPLNHIIYPKTAFLNGYSFNTTPEVGYGKEEFQVMKLLEEPEHDTTLALRRFGAVEPFDSSTSNIPNDSAGFDPNDDVFSLQKIFPPEKQPQILDENSIVATKNFVLNEIIDSRENETIGEAVNSNTSCCVTGFDSNDENTKITDKEINKLKPKRRINKSVTEMNDEHAMKFEKIMNRENQILKILSRQTELLEQVAKLLDSNHREKAIARMDSAIDFDEILKEVNKRAAKLGKNTTLTQIAEAVVKEKFNNLGQGKGKSLTKTTAKTQLKMLSTVKTVIEETDVKKALKNDPYVKRILKIAKSKRSQYLNDAAKAM